MTPEEEKQQHDRITRYRQVSATIEDLEKAMEKLVDQKIELLKISMTGTPEVEYLEKGHDKFGRVCFIPNTPEIVDEIREAIFNIICNHKAHLENVARDI